MTVRTMSLVAPMAPQSAKRTTRMMHPSHVHAHFKALTMVRSSLTSARLDTLRRVALGPLSLLMFERRLRNTPDQFATVSELTDSDAANQVSTSMASA